MNTLGLPSARRLHLLQPVLGAVLLAAASTWGFAQGSSRGDIRFTLVGGDHAGDYALLDVPLFLCGFDYSGPGSFALQWYADDPTAQPSIIQLSHEEVLPDMGFWSADVLIGFGDINEDGVIYMIQAKQDMGTVESTIDDQGETAVLTMVGTTGSGVEVTVDAGCHGVSRFERGG